MRTEIELEKMAEQLGNLADLPPDEAAKRFLEVCGDLPGEDLPQLAVVSTRLADIHQGVAKSLQILDAKKRKYPDNLDKAAQEAIKSIRRLPHSDEVMKRVRQLLSTR
jgi:hypothetical protein